MGSALTLPRSEGGWATAPPPCLPFCAARGLVPLALHKVLPASCVRSCLPHSGSSARAWVFSVERACVQGGLWARTQTPGHSQGLWCPWWLAVVISHWESWGQVRDPALGTSATAQSKVRPPGPLPGRIELKVFSFGRHWGSGTGVWLAECGPCWAPQVPLGTDFMLSFRPIPEAWATFPAYGMFVQEQFSGSKLDPSPEMSLLQMGDKHASGSGSCLAELP